MAQLEPTYTKLNLTYPPQPFNSTGTVFLNGTTDPTSGDLETSNTAILPALLIPHAITTLFILLRTTSRLLLLRRWFLDDTLILLAWLFSTAVATVYSLASQTPSLRLAVTLTDLTIPTLPPATAASIDVYILSAYLGLIFYQLTLLLTKLSILSFYLRIFSSRPLERTLAIATTVIIILYGIPLLFISVFQCHPSSPESTYFSHSLSKCFSFPPLLIASASLHTVTDAWLIVLITPCIVRLTLPRSQKVALAVVMSLSVCVVAASLTRLQLSLHAGGGEVKNTMAFFVMTVLECDVAVVCACAPTLRPLLGKVWPGGWMGDGGERKRRRRLRRRRSEGEMEEVEEDGSVNLTVVSYHGYPWAQKMDGAGTNVSMAWERERDADLDVALPTVPVPAAFRTPTTLSLRSFMSQIAPRSRGQTVRGEDREVLLGDERRRSSVAFEGYYDQYLGYGAEEKRRSRRGNSWVGGAAWAPGDSQESFVMGVNDPASPTRLSPVSAGSGMAYPGLADETGEGKMEDKEGTKVHC